VNGSGVPTHQEVTALFGCKITIFNSVTAVYNFNKYALYAINCLSIENSEIYGRVELSKLLMTT
jgi:hypothetical protein